MKFKLLPILFFFFLTKQIVLSQDIRYRIQHITSDNGLSQNFIECIFQDSRGFMWFGTRDGLNRYDGYSFVVYKTTDGTGNDISDNFIQSIKEDRHGNLWIGTRFGLNRFDFNSNKFTRFINQTNDPQTISSNWVNDIMVDKKGNLWIGTQDGGLEYLDVQELNKEKPKFAHRKTDSRSSNSLINNTVTTILEDDKGKIWTGTEGGVCILNRQSNTWERFSAEANDASSLSNNSVHVIHQTKNKEIWIGTEAGLNLFLPSQKRFKQYLVASNKENGLKNGSIQTIIEDKTNKLLIGTLGGLHQLNRETDGFYFFPVNVNDDYSLNNEFVNSLFCSENGVVWIGTEKGGINKFNVFQKNFYLLSNDFNGHKGLNCLIANSIYEDQQHLWIGTAGGGLNRYDKSKQQFSYFKNTPQAGSISHNFISALKGDVEGNLWIGTWGGGLCKLDTKRSGTTFKTYFNAASNKGVTTKFISSLAFDDLGMLWMGGSALEVLDPKTENNYHLNTNPSRYSNIPGIGCMLFDRKGNLWCGTITGLYKISLGKSYQISERIKNANIELIQHDPNINNSLSTNYITCIYEDLKGELWFGTYGKGLNKLIGYDTKTQSYQFTNYTQKDGLSNNVIYGIIEDEEGNLWVSTDKGLSKFDPKQKVFHNYYVFDGLQGNQFYWSAFYKNAKGQMYFGGTNGVSYFNPKEIVESKDLPQVVITDFKIFNRSVVSDSIYRSKLSESLTSTKHIELSYKENMVSIEFAALGYDQPEKTEYAYKMEGIDKDWVYVNSTRRFANYTNLKGGKYIFKVKATNCDGIWNEKATEISIDVDPPFWKTIWFELLVSITAAGLIVVYLQVRTNSLKKQTKKLETQVLRRTQQIQQQKEDLQSRSEELQQANTQLEEHNQLIEEQKAELEANNHQIASQRDELIELNKKVKLVSQMKVEFFTNISHEFRTPLTLILGPLEKVLANYQQEDDTKSNLMLIKRNTQRLLHLVNELMDFRKIETKKMDLVLVEDDIVSFVHIMAKGFNQMAELRKIDFKFESKLDKMIVQFDFMKIEKIVYNLISNAFKFTPNNGSIHVSIEHKTPSSESKYFAYTYGRINEGTEYIDITVKDTGIGMDEQHLQHILKKFYRVNSTEVASVVGSGIGLSLTKNLVKLHNGFLGVNSKKNKGSEFSVFLPVRQHQMVEHPLDHSYSYQPDELKAQVDFLMEEMIAANKSIETTEQSKKNGGARVLVVEDNLDLRTFIVKHLEANFKVLEAANGEEGLKIAIEKTPELIISDIMMPVMNGVEMCSKLKKDLNTCHIPVILLTAKNDKETQLLGYETGADDYIPKPFDIQILEARISSFIKNRRELRKSFIANVNLSAEKVVTNSTDEAFLQKAINVVKENLMDPNFGVQHLIDKMCVSHSLLHKKLVSLTNQSAVDFITSIRLNQSIQLMKSQNMSLSEIAFKVGFNDPKYFSRCFKKFFGKSPSEYASTNLLSDI